VEANPAHRDDKREFDWRFRLLLATAPRLFHLFANIVFRTLRVTVIGKEHEDTFLRRGEPMLFVSWHQGLLYFAYHFRNRNGIVMLSRSRDGELIDRTVKLFGFQSARGSSSRGGRQALEVMVEKVNATRCSAGLVADGPRGPFGVAKIGIIKLAKETGLPLLPVMWWAKPKIMFNSWDKTLLPLPFSRLVFFYEAPIYVRADAGREEMENLRVDLTNLLNRMHTQAREYLGERP